MANASNQITRILYKEIAEGDLLKFKAISNTSDTGGGARDLRIRPFDEFLPVIKLIFPETVTEKRRRGGKSVNQDIFKGKFHSTDSTGKDKIEDVYFEPPTDARPNEGRIARVSSYTCFHTTLQFKANDKIFLLLVQMTDKSVWPYFYYESSFRQKGLWHPTVEKALTDCVDAKRAKGNVVMGYYDFTTQKGYCNGK